MTPARRDDFQAHRGRNRSGGKRREPAGRPPHGARRPPDALALAARVVGEVLATKEPADRVLRARLREAHPPQDVAGAAARAVFAWFRWRWFLPGRDQTGPAAIRHAAEMAAQFAAEPRAFDDTALMRGALPGWLGAHMEVTAAFARALQQEPRLWLRARPGRAQPCAAALAGARAGLVPGLPEAIRYDGEGDLFRTAGFKAGDFEIQDLNSQAVGAVCAPAAGETWWDACAGEGGKTLHLADLMGNRGLIWATDRSEARLAVLRRRAARAGVFNYRIAAWDGGPRLPTRTRFDGVLIDAPCSGVGTWQRNPHARWTLTPDDVRELSAMQVRLLATAAPAVKPGGRLVYAVCTLTRDETLDVAAAFAEQCPGFEPAPFLDPHAPASPPGATVYWRPETSGGNGMFVAAWRRLPDR